MGDLVNLNKFRKAKQRRDEEGQAVINRDKFGRTKAEAKRTRQAHEQAEKSLDAKKLESDSTKGKGGGDNDQR